MSDIDHKGRMGNKKNFASLDYLLHHGHLVISDPNPYLAIALHIPSKTGTMHLQVDFLVLKGEGLSCFFISNSFIKMMFIKST